MEIPIAFSSDDLSIEGLYNENNSSSCAIVTHPHPLYGGDMYNPVVETICRSYALAGYSTLRFNFRGVGRSTGAHDEGKGERRDVLGAIAHLLELGVQNIHLAGYSFGSHVLATIDELPEGVVSQLFVSPPVGFMDFSDISGLGVLKLVIAGEYDDIAPHAIIGSMLPDWNNDAKLRVVPRTDHFYSGTLDVLEKTLVEELQAHTL